MDGAEDIWPKILESTSGPLRSIAEKATSEEWRTSRFFSELYRKGVRGQIPVSVNSDLFLDELVEPDFPDFWATHEGFRAAVMKYAKLIQQGDDRRMKKMLSIWKSSEALSSPSPERELLLAWLREGALARERMALIRDFFHAESEIHDLEATDLMQIKRISSLRMADLHLLRPSLEVCKRLVEFFARRLCTTGRRLKKVDLIGLYAIIDNPNLYERKMSQSRTKELLSKLDGMTVVEMRFALWFCFVCSEPKFFRNHWPSVAPGVAERLLLPPSQDAKPRTQVAIHASLPLVLLSPGALKQKAGRIDEHVRNYGAPLDVWLVMTYLRNRTWEEFQGDFETRYLETPMPFHIIRPAIRRGKAETFSGIASSRIAKWENLTGRPCMRLAVLYPQSNYGRKWLPFALEVDSLNHSFIDELWLLGKDTTDIEREVLERLLEAELKRVPANHPLVGKAAGVRYDWLKDKEGAEELLAKALEIDLAREDLHFTSAMAAMMRIKIGHELLNKCFDRLKAQQPETAPFLDWTQDVLLHENNGGVFPTSSFASFVKIYGLAEYGPRAVLIKEIMSHLGNHRNQEEILKHFAFHGLSNVQHTKPNLEILLSLMLRAKTQGSLR